MGENNVDASVIKRTQDALGKYVRKPPLTEKLLKKPPFRFLHDVFSVVIKDTGCFVDLYTPDELNIENIKDRDDKMRFLQKMIDVIKLSTGAPLTVRTSKIVAGHEPEKTNELLQRMAEVIERKLDWQSAVKQVVAGKPDELDVDRSKNPENAKESKTRDKPVERAKVKEKDTTKESKGRESKTKLTKDSAKHISPTGNEQKPTKKINGSREKQPSVEKVPTKSRLEKVQREQQETKDSKNIKKSKGATEGQKATSKHKMEAKTKSPSPVKADTSDTKKTKDTKGESKVSPTKIDAKYQNHNSVQGETAIGGGVLKEPSIEDSQADNQRSSKHATELVTNVVAAAAVAAESSTKQIDAAVVHKSTEKRKGSSNSKNRRSSANKANREEPPASLTQQLSSLQLTNQTDSMLNEAQQQKQVNATEQAAMTTPQKQSDTSRNANANVGRAELKRESTFTREERAKTMNNGGGVEGDADIGADSKNKNNAINGAISNGVTNSPPSVNNNNNHSDNLYDSNKNSRKSSTNSNNNKNNSTGNKSSDDGTNARPRTSLRPPSARPASARPGAPRRRDKNVEIVLQPNDQVKMSGINVKLETFGDFGDDDGENLVVIEDSNAALNGTDAASHSTAEDTTAHDVNKLEQQGHLVQQILDTQKELVQQNVELTGQGDKKNATGSAGSGSSTRHSSARHMDNLRDVIQNLTKSVNPFGKLMDFIPEDIDAMQLELSMWRDSYVQAANELKRERSLTESTTEPMKLQLVQIEANTKEYMEMIDASRMKILLNADKIVRMLTEQ